MDWELQCVVVVVGLWDWRLSSVDNGWTSRPCVERLPRSWSTPDREGPYLASLSSPVRYLSTRISCRCWSCSGCSGLDDGFDELVGDCDGCLLDELTTTTTFDSFLMFVVVYVVDVSPVIRLYLQKRTGRLAILGEKELCFNNLSITVFSIQLLNFILSKL